MTPTATLDSSAIRLSESVRATLTIEGQAPLRVVLPKEPLDDASSAVWRARAVDSPTIEELPGGKQKWSITYRVDPYTPGDALPLTFAPAQAYTGTDPQPKPVAWPTLTVRVVTGVKGDVLTEARPVTGVEEVPGPSGVAWAPGWWVAAAAAVVLTAAVLLHRKRHRPVPLSPAEQAITGLGPLSDVDLSSAAFAARLSDVVRRYAERTTATPATTLTTPELLVEFEKVGRWPPDLVAEVRSVLAACDEAKFAGSTLPEDARRAMIEATHRFVSWAPPPTLLSATTGENEPCDRTPPAAGS